MKSSVDLAMRKSDSCEMFETSGDDFIMVLTRAKGSVTTWLSISASLILASLVGDVAVAVVVAAVVVVVVAFSPMVFCESRLPTIYSGSTESSRDKAGLKQKIEGIS